MPSESTPAEEAPLRAEARDVLGEPGSRNEELVATTALLRAGIVPPHRLASTLDHLGSAVALLGHVLGKRSISFPSNGEWSGAISVEDVESARRDVDSWLERGLAAVTVLDPDYPLQLHEIFNRPPLLFVDGRLQSDDWRSVAVVGTRKATPDGLRRARKLTRQLAARGLTIVSGLAAGIDTVAHETALDCGARTVAVMGTGIDHRFPKENAGLADRIVEAGGALLSQFFPDQGPRRWTFPMRNAVMSGFALATVVVEAGPTSGAKMQARLALEHGRTVFLLRSLVEGHRWAHDYVAEAKAVAVDSTDEIVERLEGKLELELSLAV